MREDILVHKKTLEFSGENYQILVYCRQDGKHLAKTYFGEDDVIINDGATLQEALEKHEKVLPLAVSSRKILKEFRTFTRGSKGYRP